MSVGAAGVPIVVEGDCEQIRGRRAEDRALSSWYAAWPGSVLIVSKPILFLLLLELLLLPKTESTEDGDGECDHTSTIKERIHVSPFLQQDGNDNNRHTRYRTDQAI